MVFVIKIQADAVMKLLCIVLQLIQETLIYKHQVKEKESVIDLQKLTNMVLVK